MREIGKGHTALSTYCDYMNIPEPMNKKAFQDIQGKNFIVFIDRQYCAKTRSMLRAAKELQVNNSEEELENSDTKIDEIAIKTVSCDETL